MKHKTIILTALVCSLLVCHSANASTQYANYISGNVKDITSIHGALLVRMDDDRVPIQCQAAGSSWLKIDQTDTAMVSTVLTYWAQGKTAFTIYIDSWSSGYCSVAQADPAN